MQFVLQKYIENHETTYWLKIQHREQLVSPKNDVKIRFHCIERDEGTNLRNLCQLGELSSVE